MQTYYNQLVNKPRKIAQIDEQLYNQLTAKFPGTAADYKFSTRPQHDFLILELHSIISEYIKLVAVPKRVNFQTGKIISTNEKQKDDLEHKFWLKTTDYTIEKNTCSNCGNLKLGATCQNCFFEPQSYGKSYSDMLRTNFNTKYSYFRRQHFYDCIIQYQGLQPAHLDNETLAKLQKLWDSNKHSKITKHNLMKWLKDINTIKNYENIHLIYSILSGIPCPNIAHLETELLEDFDKFLVEYNKIFKEFDTKKTRKNFINIQFVLYQLLSRRNFSCKQEDFLIPKTIEIRKLYDDICGKIFKVLEWNYTQLK